MLLLTSGLVVLEEQEGSGLPTVLFSLCPGGEADGFSQGGRRQQLLDCRNSLCLFVEEIAAHAVLNHFGDAAGSSSDNGYAGGHGFKDDQAEGLGAGRHDEDVAGGIGLGEFISVQEAGHVDRESCEVLLEMLVVGTTADQGEAGGGVGHENWFEAFDFFFRGKAADIQEQRVLWVSFGEAGAHFRGAAHGLESICVDAAGPQSEAFDSMLLQLLEHGDRGAEIEGCAIMAFAQNGPDPRLHEAKTVVMEVLGQIGVVGDNQGQMEGSAVLSATVIQPGNAQQGWVGDVDEVGLKFDDGPAYGSVGKCKAKLRIDEERVALGADDAGLLKVVETAIRGKDKDLVAKFFQLVDSLAEGGDDAVHFGDEGFSEEGNSHDRARLIY